ncbi:MAG: ankyrin repeat domain-containing protein, partial [Phormidesmis sp.]
MSSKLTAIGLLGAIGAATLATTPVVAQTVSADDDAEAISPFCQVLLEKASLWGSSPDLLDALKAAAEQGGDLNQLCDFYGDQILPLNTLLSSDEAIARHLIEQGVDVNARDGKGNTPLHAVGESVEMARLLVDRGANVNAKDYQGSTPLHNVFRQKTTAVMALLIEQGADVNAISEGGMTPLHYAGTGGIAALLIAQSADVNARSDQDWTPLHYAVSNFDVAAQLIQAGADLTIQNREGAVIHASGLSADVLQLLLDAG